jgi:hypothetical protein
MSGTPVIEVVSGQPVTVEVVTPNDTQIVQIGVAGPQGPRGNPGITVSSTPPLNPQVNDLWLQIP